jgi:hypothetical protein
MLRSPPHDHRRSAPWSCHSCRSGPNCGSAKFLRTRWAAWTAHKTDAYCARHRCGADEAVLVRVSARTDSRFRGKRRPMSFMNRAGSSIHFIDTSIAPEMPRTVLAGLNLCSMETSPSGRARRNAQLAIAPVLITSAARKSSAHNSNLPAALTALPTPTWASPFRGRLYSRRRGDAPGAHKRSPRLRVTILSRACRRAPSNEHDSRLASSEIPSMAMG